MNILNSILAIYDVKQVICPVYAQSVYEALNIKFNIENVDLNLCTMVVVHDNWQVTRGKVKFNFVFVELLFKFKTLRVYISNNFHLIETNGTFSCFQ